jgi:hypothetical protein
MAFWCGSGSGSGCGSDPDPDPTIFLIDLQDANKKIIFLFKSFFAYDFLKVHLHIIFKDKKSKRSHKAV